MGVGKTPVPFSCVLAGILETLESTVLTVLYVHLCVWMCGQCVKKVAFLGASGWHDPPNGMHMCSTRHRLSTLRMPLSSRRSSRTWEPTSASRVSSSGWRSWSRACTETVRASALQLAGDGAVALQHCAVASRVLSSGWRSWCRACTVRVGTELGDVRLTTARCAPSAAALEALHHCYASACIHQQAAVCWALSCEGP